MQESAACTRVMSYALEDIPKSGSYRLGMDGRAGHAACEWSSTWNELRRARKQNRDLGGLNPCLVVREDGKSQARL